MFPTLHQHIPRARNKEENLLLSDEAYVGKRARFIPLVYVGSSLLQRDLEEYSYIKRDMSDQRHKMSDMVCCTHSDTALYAFYIVSE